MNLQNKTVKSCYIYKRRRKNLGEADETLMKALKLKFMVGKWHSSAAQNLFKTSEATVETY